MLNWHDTHISYHVIFLYSFVYKAHSCIKQLTKTT